MESERNTDKPKTYQSLSSVAYKFGWVLGCGSALREETLVRFPLLRYYRSRTQVTNDASFVHGRSTNLPRVWRNSSCRNASRTSSRAKTPVGIIRSPVRASFLPGSVATVNAPHASIAVCGASVVIEIESGTVSLGLCATQRKAPQQLNKKGRNPGFRPSRSRNGCGGQI
jgi:hypothetical protein